MSSNTAENQSKSDDKPSVSFSNIQGHTTFTYNQGNNNQIMNYVSGDIILDNESVQKMDPVFQESIMEFTDRLDTLLKEEKGITKEKIESVKNELINVTGEFKGINPKEEITDEVKKESAIKTLKDLAYKIVDMSPQIAETITSMTPLAPFTKPIGKGLTYLKDLIKYKLSEP